MSYVTELPLVKIECDPELQPRAMMNAVTIEEYREEIESGEKFPPVVVFDDDGTFWLADGFHRYDATAQAGIAHIEAEVREGTKRDAILYSVQANSTHGLRRSSADKRKAVITLLEDEEWATWSDREIARRTHTSHTFVAKVRQQTGNVASERTYQDRHGNVTTMYTGNIADANRDRAEDESASPAQLRAGLFNYLREDMGDASTGEQLEALYKAKAAHDYREMEKYLPKYAEMDLQGAITSVIRVLSEQLTAQAKAEAEEEIASAPTSPAREEEPEDRKDNARAPDLQKRPKPAVKPPAPRKKPTRKKPNLPPPSEQIKPRTGVLTVRISDGEEMEKRSIMVSLGDEGKGPSVFFRGVLAEMPDLMEKALVRFYGDKAKAIFNGNGAEQEALPIGDFDAPDLPFGVGDVVTWTYGSVPAYGRVESFSGSHERAYVRTTQGKRQIVDVDQLEKAEAEEV